MSIIDSDLIFLSLDDFICQSGLVIPNLSLAYRAYGKLNYKRDNVVVLPTHFTGFDTDYLEWIGPGKALDTDHYFILVINLFGNGVSSSPSNMPAPYNENNFPDITIFDNVKAQWLLLQALKVESIALVLGWSMGAVQSYQWCAQYPRMVKRALIMCGTAKTALHNQVFLSGIKSCLETDKNFNEGAFSTQPIDGLKSFARVYAGWAYSQAFYRHERFREMGFSSADELLASWEQDHLLWNANDLLAMLNTWYTADISNQDPYNGNLNQALASITAKIWLMPCKQDLYFRYEDNLIELESLTNAHYFSFDSDFGHCAPAPSRFPLESALVEKTIKSLLSTEV